MDNSITTWIIVALLVLLIGAAIFMLLRRPGGDDTLDGSDAPMVDRRPADRPTGTDGRTAPEEAQAVAPEGQPTRADEPFDQSSFDGAAAAPAAEPVDAQPQEEAYAPEGGYTPEPYAPEEIYTQDGTDEPEQAAAPEGAYAPEQTHAPEEAYAPEDSPAAEHTPEADVTQSPADDPFMEPAMDPVAEPVTDPLAEPVDDQDRSGVDPRTDGHLIMDDGSAPTGEGDEDPRTDGHRLMDGTHEDADRNRGRDAGAIGAAGAAGAGAAAGSTEPTPEDTTQLPQDQGDLGTPASEGYHAEPASEGYQAEPAAPDAYQEPPAHSEPSADAATYQEQPAHQEPSHDATAYQEQPASTPTQTDAAPTVGTVEDPLTADEVLDARADDARMTDAPVDDQAQAAPVHHEHAAPVDEPMTEPTADAAGGAVFAESVYGAGSAEPAEDGSGPVGWEVKGNSGSMLFHTADSPSYDAVRAEVWFENEDAARNAGFAHWDRRQR